MQILQGDKILQPSKIPMELIGMQIRSSNRFEITIFLLREYRFKTTFYLDRFFEMFGKV